MQILVEDEHFIQRRHLLQFVTVQLAGFCEITGVKRLMLETVQLEELQELAVSTVEQLPLLQLSDVVHLQRADERHLHAEATVDASAVQANVNAIVH